MSFDNSKYHVEINSVPYNIMGYQKTEVSTFIPRLGSGDQSESEFDLLKSRTIDGFEAGSLQRYFADNNSVFATEGLYPIYDDGTLYPVNGVEVSDGLIGADPAVMTAYLVTEEYVFIASKKYTGSTNSIRRIEKDGTSTTLTLPANISSSSRTIVSMVIFDNKLWVGLDDGLTLGQMSLTSGTTTVSEVGSGTSTECVGGQLIVFKGGLYGADGSTASATSAVIRKHTGGTSARTFETVGDTGVRNHDSTAKLFKYNNRIWLARKDGLWAYDGIQMVDIETTEFYDSNNYMFPRVLKGYLYFFMPDGWYRFNGSLIEKIYDISEIGFPRDVFVGKNRIWLVYPNSSISGSSRYDKAMGYNYSTGNNVDGRIMCFNGKGMFTYARTTTFVKNPATEDFAGQGEIHNGFWFDDKVYILQFYEKTTGNEYFTIDTDEQNLSGTKSISIVTSVDDADFPMVDKSLENVQCIFDGDITLDNTITIEYRTAGFDGSTGWTRFGEITTEEKPKCEVWEENTNSITYKQLQLKFTGTVNVTYGFKQLVTRYMLHPDFKWQWQFTALCYGDNTLEPLMLADETEGTQAVQTLRGNIIQARDTNGIIKFLDIDCLDLAEDLTISETICYVNDTQLLKGTSGFVQIDDEIMEWHNKTASSITLIRAVMGTTATTHTNNSKIFIVYRAIIRQIVNERVELTNPESTSEDKARASEITLLIQEV